MADTKISALPSATTPLTGAELVPLVQTGGNVKVSVDNLTAGRSLSVSGMTLTGGTANGVAYLNGSKVLTSGADLTFNGTILTSTGFAGPLNGTVGATTANTGAFTTLSATSFTNSGLTSGRVTFAGTGGLLQDSANLTFNGTVLTANTIGAFTLGGTVAGGGNQLNNVIIGASTPLAGSFTTLTASSTLTVTGAGSIEGLTVGRGAGAVATNTAVGASALAANTSGSANTAFGNLALKVNTTGVGHVSVGHDSLALNTTGSDNTAVGRSALSANTTGSSNTGLGYFALVNNTTASNNTAVGYQAGYSNTTGGSNAVVGHQALYAGSTSSQNAAVGYQALYNNTSGGSTAVGYRAGVSTTTGYIVALGYNALQANTTGSNNVAIGDSTLFLNTTASNNTAVGYQAGYSNTTGASNVAVGYQAGYSNTTGAVSTFVGNIAGYANTTGQITAVGHAALTANTTAIANTAVGVSSLRNNTTGQYNTAFGDSALQLNTTASNNTAVGYRAGYSTTTGAYNTFIGLEAGRDSAFSGNGGNTCVGASAGAVLTTGTYNTFIGAQGKVSNGSGGLITTGSNNTIIGGYNGNQGGLDIRTANNHIVLSDGDGNPRGIFDSDGDWIVGATSAVTTGYGKSLTAAKSHVYFVMVGNSNSTAFANQRTALFVDADTGGTNNEYADSAILINNTTGLATNPGAMIRAYHQRFGVSSDNPLRVFEVNYLGNIGLGNTDASTSGNGITFPATQSASSNANTLDDYEEGTWTCTMSPTSGFTPTNNTSTGYYTKIGRVVTVMSIAGMTIPASLGSYSNDNTSFAVIITGLPFTIQPSDTNARSAPAIGVGQNLGTSNGCLAGHGSTSTGEISIFQNKDSGATRTSPNLFVSTTANLHFQFTYFTS